MSGGVKGPWTAQEEYFKEQLNIMAKRPENMECADCTSKAPKWAVYNHGIFVCIKCSGQHRNLGTDISCVRSINMDRWKQHQFDMMIGNEAANAELLYNLPPGMKKPREDDDYGRQKWIYQKYVQRKWARRPDQPPVKPGEQHVAQQPVTQPHQYPYQPQQHYYVHVPSVYPVSPAQLPHIPVVPAPLYIPAQPQAQPVPPPQPPKYQPVEDLLDMFSCSTPSAQITSYQSPKAVIPFSPAMPPQPYYYNVYSPHAQQPPVYVAPPAAQQQAYFKQSDGMFDDLMAMYDQPKIVPQSPVQYPTSPAYKKAGFDISAFINSGPSYNSYKPQGFYW